MGQSPAARPAPLATNANSRDANLPFSTYSTPVPCVQDGPGLSIPCIFEGEAT